jgi:hypothetical protein
MSSRIDIYRSRAAGCRWAAQIVQHEDTRALLHRIANQYCEIADQLELIGKLQAAAVVGARGRATRPARRQ